MKHLVLIILLSIPLSGCIVSAMSLAGAGLETIGTAIDEDSEN